MKLIFIHGREQERKDPSELQKLWEDSFFIGLEIAKLKLNTAPEVIFPYYGDKLYDFVERIPSFNDILMKGPENEESDELLKFRHAVLLEVAREHGVTDEDLQEFDDEMEFNRGFTNRRSVLKLLRWLEQSNLAGKLILNSKTEDTYQYLFNPYLRTYIDDIVRKNICDGPCVVIGHSMGSIVGYNVLNAVSEVEVKGFVTIGSPLGIKAIRLKLDKPLRKPASISGDWFNARDIADTVALRPLIDPFFGIEPPITNYDGVKNGSENHHSVEGYLTDPIVAKAIYDAIL